MRNLIRAGLGGAAAVAALALSGSALAAMNPRLVVDTGLHGAKTLTIGARLGQTDDWLGRLQVYVPSGYKLPAGAAATVSTQAIATQVGPSVIMAMSGTLHAPTANDAAAISWATTNCDNTAHAATWLTTMTGSDDNWTIPVFLDQTTGSETAFGSQKLVVCFGPRSVGSLNSQGNKLISLSMTLRGVTSPGTSGDYLWRSMWTPLAGASGDNLDQSASVEAQSTVHIQPATLTIAAKKSHGRVVLSGKLVFGGEPMDGIRINVKHGIATSKLVTLANVKTSSNGAWTTRAKAKKPQWYQAGATIGESDLGAGACKASFGLPCLSATAGGTGFSSRLIHVK